MSQHVFYVEVVASDAQSANRSWKAINAAALKESSDSQILGSVVLDADSRVLKRAKIRRAISSKVAEAVQSELKFS